MRGKHVGIQIVIGLGLLVGGLWPAEFASASGDRPGVCQEVHLALATAPGGRPYTIAGTLCTPDVWAAGVHEVDVMVPGGMYNRQYWDWPMQAAQYSYVDRTLQAGRAAFTYDRLGTGASSHPASVQVTYDGDIYQLHQIISWLRGTYSQVNTIGHSLGSVIAVDEAGRYHDTDRVVVTGLTHGHGLGFLTLPTAIEPAGLDPQFLGVVPFLDAGYVTTIPGKRAGLFYSALADPAVIAYDEAHKDVMTVLVAAGAIASLTVPAGLNVSNAITAPVMLIVGEEDAPFCNVDVNCSTADGVRNHEAPYYTGAASLTVQTVAGTGHDLPLHPSGGTSFAAINAWMRSH